MGYCMLMHEGGSVSKCTFAGSARKHMQVDILRCSAAAPDLLATLHRRVPVWIVTAVVVGLMALLAARQASQRLASSRGPAPFTSRRPLACSAMAGAQQVGVIQGCDRWWKTHIRPGLVLASWTQKTLIHCLRIEYIYAHCSADHTLSYVTLTRAAGRNDMHEEAVCLAGAHASYEACMAAGCSPSPSLAAAGWASRSLRWAQATT